MSRAAKALACVRAFALLALTAAAALASEKLSGADGDFFTELRLENGLRVLLAECPGSGLVATTVFVGAGSIRETAGLNGAAHFLEHLLFNGTTSRTQEQLYADVDRIGAYNNASTREDYAVFMFVAGVESAETALGIQADMLFRSTLPAEKFEKERGIVLEEIAKDGSDPSYASSLLTKHVLYAGSSYELPVLGTDETIRALDRGRVLDYYHRYYVPSNMTLLVMGDMRKSAMRDLVTHTFGDAPAGPAPEPPVRLPVLAGFRRLVEPFDDRARHVLIRLPAPMPGDADYAALELVNDVLGGGDGSRLARAFEAEPKLPVSEVSSSLVVLGGRSFLEIGAELEPDRDPGPVLARALGEIARLASEPIDARELAAAEVSRRTGETRLREQIHYYGFMRADLVLHAPIGFLNTQRERYAALTPAAVHEAAARWLAPSEGLVVLTGPGLETANETLEPGELGLRMPAFALPALGGTALGNAPKPAPRATHVTPAAEHHLANGLRVVVSSDPASDILAVHVMALGRSFVEPAGQEGVTDFVHRLMLRGAGTWTKAELAARLDAIGASVKSVDVAAIPYDDYYTTPEFSYVRFETLDGAYAEAFDLLGAIVTAPTFEATEIEAVRAEMLQLAAQREGEPRQVMDTAVRSAIYGPGAPGARSIVGTTASLRALTPADLRAWHARYFRPSNLVVTVVTGLPVDTVLARVEKGFRFPSGVGAGAPDGAGVPDMRPPVTARGEAVPERALGKPQSRVGLAYAFDFTPADEAPLRAASLLLSDRMSFQLRERLGLAYDIGAGFRAWKGARGLLTTAMGTRPENIAQAIDGMAAQIDSMSVAPLTDDTVVVAVNAQVGRLRMQRITRMGQAYHLSMDVLRGDPPGELEKRLRSLREVSPADVKRVAERYLRSADACRVVVR